MLAGEMRWATRVPGNRLAVSSGKQHHVLQDNEYVCPAFHRTQQVKLASVRQDTHTSQ